MRRLLLLAIVVATLTIGATPAMAHGDEVQLEVLEATPADTGAAVTYRVALTYVNDGDGIDGATVTATASLPGALVAPVTLDPAGEPGVYAGTVLFPTPGNWTIDISSPDPEALISVTFNIEEPAPGTTAAPTPTVTNPPATSTPIEPNLTDADVEDDGPPAFLIVGLVVTGLLVVGAAATLLIQRLRRDR